MSELSLNEKITILAIADAKAIKRKDYDMKFYDALLVNKFVDPSEVKDEIRRALIAYVENVVSDTKIPYGDIPVYLLGFIEGYQLARKINVDIIAKKPKEPEKPADPNRLL